MLPVPQTPSAGVSAEQQFNVNNASSPSPSNHDAISSSESLPTPLPSSGLVTPTSERHPKGKRKRTATKDKLILEEAYTINPKPDKQARLGIVDRVSLNEKEVQIWFQNRRQNDRRKSRPLSPHELATLRFIGVRGLSSDPVTSQNLLAEPDETFHASDPAACQTAADQASSTSPHVPVSPQQSRSHSAPEAVNATPRFTSLNTSSSSLSHVRTPQRQGYSSSQDSQDGSLFSQTFSSSLGYLANRWNLGSSFLTPSTVSRRKNDSFKLDCFPPSSCSSNSSYRANQSHMRLSLSLEGKAEIVPNVSSPTQETPSRPASTLPYLPQFHPRSLQRSHSEFPTITLPPISALTNSLPPRLGRGRSRDVHAWELCADSDTRDRLTTQAEHESNGSAIAAISLLRSTSGILQPSGTKRNAPVTKFTRSLQAKKPKLISRTSSSSSSSVARLESMVGDAEKPRESLDSKMNVSMLVSPTDSDKENWSPDDDGNLHEGHRRPLPACSLKMQNPRRLGRFLQHNKSPSFLNHRVNSAPSALRALAKGVEIFRDEENKPDSPREDEDGKVVRSETSPIKKGDMDCVAGLLSLSQGAWR